MLSASLPAPATATVSTTLVDGLVRLGVTQAYGVMGGAMAAFFHALAHSPITTVHARHEAGAAFAAIEASLASRRPVVVYTTAGPGLANALNGMLAARWDGAHVLFISACTIAPNRGRAATQETTAALLGPTLFQAGGTLDYAAVIEHPSQLGPVLTQLAAGFQDPSGFVAHVSLPIDLQKAPCGRLPALGDRRGLVPSCPMHLVREHAALLDRGNPVIWVGYGARHAAPQVRALTERLGARVMCSPRGKGIFPEDHPLFLGVTGLAGHEEVEGSLAARRPTHTLVLGTRMGEATSFWSPGLTPSEAFIQVDTDPEVFGLAYPEVPVHPAVAEIGDYLDALVAALGPARRGVIAEARRAPELLTPRAGAVRPQLLMQELQRVAVDGSDAWIMGESGNSFCWTTHYLRFSVPNRYRLSPTWGSMGHATCGVVGAALARAGKAIAVTGDGAMLMQNELHTAVQHQADAVWIVLNDGGYLMCAQGMQMMGWEPFHCALPRVDFVAMARSLGADGERVTSEDEMGAALERAMAARGPWVLDVHIDPAERPPSGMRNHSLMQQGFNAAVRQ